MHNSIMRAITRAFLITWVVLACSIQAHADSVNDLLLPGPVIQGHVKYESDCANCHKQFDKSAQSGLCKDCHKEIKKDIDDKRGYHGLMKEEKECKECHTEHRGRDARIAKLNTVDFDHAVTGFVLKGGHLKEKVLCKDCHFPQKKYREAPTKCVSCHEKVDKHKGSLGKECANCHEEKDWKTTHFDHSKTHFPLLGKHVDVKCKGCHINDKFKEAPLQCSGCHKKDDKHKGSFGFKCETCHTDRGWKEILFDHDKGTKYPLLGKHHEVKCVSCHKGNLYKEKLKTDCNSCHRKDDKHKGSFGSKCESCHLERGWKELLFDHDRKTKFPLLGKHHDVKCVSCHKGDLYKEKLKTDCYSCHQKDDKHKGSFGPKCETCHVDRGWKEILFDHGRKTKYPLLGKHLETKCVSCHKGDLYKDKLKTDCYSCHQKDDKHKGQEGKKCESCHHEQSWKKTDFDHRMSRFPLTGKHLLTECKKCHLDATFKDAKSDCGSCHEKQDVHKRTLGTDCGYCHNTRDWKDWDFDHDRTNFKLEGKHKDIRCSECHKTPTDNKVTLAVSCVSCHGKDDKHDGAYGDHCEHCHIGLTWKTIKVGSKSWIKK
jgi:hypothetical protein